MSDTHAAHDAHAGDHDAHAPEPRDFTHPALWTVGLVAMSMFLVWIFFHEMSIGNAAARGEPSVPDLMKAEGGGAPEPDHTALIADRGPEVLDKGQQIFAKNCASCHGMNGDLKGGTSPQARNFHSDAFKNTCGGGPYGLYLVVTNGYGAMPAFKMLDAASRYAVVHYVRETFVKTDNAKNYLADDPPNITANIPKKGEKAGAEGPAVAPNEVTPPTTLYPIMRAMADDADVQSREIQAWADATVAGAPPEARADSERLRALAARDRALGAWLHAACRAAERERFIALLIGGQSPGAPTSEFAVMSSDRLAALYQSARAAAEGSR